MQHPGTSAFTRCPKMSKCWNGSDQDREIMLELEELERFWEETMPLCLSLRLCYTHCLQTEAARSVNHGTKWENRPNHVPRS